ncbi:HtaA domain-containing protein [Streptomyces showdoensis]|uniref:Htaa domain protein n=1 Tax=Streptomyces showdoensis TaxID=68268 RepID=A0A2P2GFS3_STREW|nr:HtaA domain-containing protein [Streptomyces showdoensis]KKZ69709.1 Htaa domain protein [Streptomyces showdoensis]
MPPFSRPGRASAVTLVATLLAVLLPAAAARADSRTVQGGRLDWGIKSSFQGYVTGPVAQGSWSLTGGAATVGSGQFRFHSAQGSYDPSTGAFEAAFSGGVRFLGHREAGGGNALDLTVSRPRVRVRDGRGTLYADMASKAKGSGVLTTRSRVPLATLDLSGIDMRGGGSPLALTGVPATLTAQGATAFAGYYPAGTPLDPVALSVDVLEAAGGQASKPAPSAPTRAPEAERPAGGFREAAVDWGVRRTFREYVTGAVARGRWALTGGAQDGGALFRFPAGRGTYDPEKRTLDAVFAGSVRFTGAHLDLTLGAVTVEVADGRGTLSADVTSAGRPPEKAVPLVTFAAGGLRPENGLATVAEAPATLTEGGARAFGGMYRAGTAMDPVSLAVAVDATAELPPLPDLGEDAKPASPAPASTSAPAPAPARASDSAPAPTVWIALGAGVVLAAAVALGAALRKRRPRTTD